MIYVTGPRKRLDLFHAFHREDESVNLRGFVPRDVHSWPLPCGRLFKIIATRSRSFMTSHQKNKTTLEPKPVDF